MSEPRKNGYVPGRHLIEAVGNGGFRFAEMSHRGSILVLPTGVHAWHVTAWDQVNATAFADLFKNAKDLDFVLIGAGEMPRALPEALRWRFKELRLSVDVMMTVAAARTYNVLAAEGRRVAAALIAV